MKKINRIKMARGFLVMLSCWVLVAVISSCNKDFNQILSQNPQNDTSAINAGTKKVLYVVLDGVRGSIVASIRPTNIVQINKNATYSYVGLNDSTRIAPTNAGSWADLMTGVNVNFHKVISDSFAGNALAIYPSLFTRLKQTNPNLKTASFASSVSFDANLATDATEHTVYNADQETKNAVVDKLKTTDASLVVAQFHSAEVAGASSGYNTGNAGYVSAIRILDSYLGEILTSLRSRSQFNNENWLVVIASNKGGVDNSVPTTDISLFGEAAKNTYVAFYNPNFDSRIYNKPNTTEIPYAGSAARFTSTTANTSLAVLNNTTVGDFGTSGNYTVIFKIRNDAVNNADYSYFLGKMPESTYLSPRTSTLTSTGWTYMFWGNYYYVCMGNAFTTTGPLLRDGLWHTLAFKIYTDGGIRYVTLFQDGVKGNTANIDGRNLTNTNGAAMHIGVSKATTTSNVTNFILRDLAIYNVAISDADMIGYMKREVNPQSQYFNNLLGWWPMKEGKENVLFDKSGKGNNFIMSNTTWSNFSDLTPNINPEIDGVAYRTVPNNVDLPFQIYNWLGVIPAASWGLTGRTWSPTYLALGTN
ncbi:DUF4983 domain-containing protein [Pedobacter heparinus]|uniref:DUF4983 domain-containing protein n=1 Tax=Pedobacter heparinus TaxID=984 RepID=UPI00292D6D7D|nr:DUF4983 domain-containing protein [Pedobacter heparinus]